MSYLTALRLHFAGRFQAAVSTVNNDPTHYDNDRFQPSYQEYGAHGTNGWWNPRGSADWHLIGCRVTAAFGVDGLRASDQDPVRECLVADSDRTVPAKMVDLDTEQQLVSEIWGLEVRLCTGNGETLMRGRFHPAAFMDIWDRSASGGGDVGAGACYQSVLTDLWWADEMASPMLRQLRDAAADGPLSIKFNVDGYSNAPSSPEFTRGRVVGTIGPGSAAEPRHFVAGRRFLAEAGQGGNFFSPKGGLNFCTAVVDETLGKIYLDLGNSMPTTTAGGRVADLGRLTLARLEDQTPIPLGDVDYRGDDQWYEHTAGVAEIPADRSLTAAELAAIADSSLALMLSSMVTGRAISEAPGGVVVTPDQHVFRLDPGDTARVRLTATRYGRPYPGAVIALSDYPDMLQTQVEKGWPDVDTPLSALRYPARVETDDAGLAEVRIVASAPGNPRGYIDGQVYGVAPALLETIGSTYPFDPWCFVSVLVADAFTADDPPTWWGSLQPIFQQYANLYPVMDRFLDLADYESVCANRDLLALAFSLGPDDPNSMPVTRDLSRAKREAILAWLKTPGPDGKPLEGTRRPSPVVRREHTHESARAASADGGGKAAAAARRVGARRTQALEGGRP